MGVSLTNVNKREKREKGKRREDDEDGIRYVDLIYGNRSFKKMYLHVSGKKYAYLADSILRSILLHFMRKRTEEKVNSQRF